MQSRNNFQPARFFLKKMSKGHVDLTHVELLAAEIFYVREIPAAHKREEDLWEREIRLISFETT